MVLGIHALPHALMLDQMISAFKYALNNVNFNMALPRQEIEHLYAAGWAALQSNRMSEAEEAFLAVLTHDPAHIDALNGLGTVYFHENRTEEAWKLYQRAKNSLLDFYSGTLPDHVNWDAPTDRALLRTLHGLALTAFRKGDTEDAEKRFQNLLDIDPEDHTGSKYMLDDIKKGRKSWDDTV